MSDDLRTRIAKVLHRRLTYKPDDEWECGWTWEQESDEEKETWLADADAVIAELGLEREGCPCDERGPNCRHRWVTDWKADDPQGSDQTDSR